MAAAATVEVDRWRRELDTLMLVVGRRFARPQPRRHARAMVEGLMAELPGTNCWTITEHLGYDSAGPLQHLLAAAVWDEDGVRDDVRSYLTEHLAHRGDPLACLVLDETGDVKKGTQTVGVQRQYTGTAGRIENSQVAVYLVLATGRGHGFIDRELYLPASWAQDASEGRPPTAGRGP